MLLLPIFILGFFLHASVVSARENVFNWYINDFQTEIVVNSDSSLDITEKITADCGNASGKHGIFRILPEEVKLDNGGVIKNPVKLVSITDFNDNPLKYAQSKNSSDKTVVWKIGDANKAVTGVNYYKIRYTVQNAIRFGNSDFDEFYWNLNGNFWDLETDNFHAKIIFPAEVNKDKSQVDYYTGPARSGLKNQASYQWAGANILEFDSIGTLKIGDGITASVTFPKNIFTPHVPSFWEVYGKYFWLILPVAVFVACFKYWLKYGKDPRVDKTVIAEYDVPGKLTPAELGMLESNGTFSNDLVTAEIINLAVMGLMTVKETTDKILFVSLKDHVLTKKDNPEKEQKLSNPQKLIYNKIFEDGNEVKLSDLKNAFYTVLDKVEKETKKIMEERKLLTTQGSRLSIGFVVWGIIAIVFSFIVFVFVQTLSGYLPASMLISGLIFLIFGLIMPKRTLEGAELNWQIKGFKSFMETVDKHRAEFYEKEFIFEKFLPYAIVFGITEIWIKKMKEIYGADYFAKHAPVWYVGTTAGFFDVDSFTKTMNSLSSSIASNTSSSSGAGGGGFSGGGGGGGGGGGW